MPAICISAPFHSLSELISLSFNPAVWNPPASDGGGMRCNTREVALSSASRDEFNLYYGTAFVIFEFHSFDLQASVADDPTVTFRLFRLCTLFLKLGSYYCGEPPAPAGGGSTYYCFRWT